MKVSKIFICLLLFVSTSALAQEKKLNFGIGMNGTTARLNLITSQVDISSGLFDYRIGESFDSITHSINNRAINFTAFAEYKNGRFIHRIGFLISPYNGDVLKESTYFFRGTPIWQTNPSNISNTYFDFFLNEHSRKIRTGLQISNEVKIFKKIYGIVNSQLIINNNSFSYGNIFIPLSTGFSYRPKENICLFLSAGKNISFKNKDLFTASAYGPYSKTKIVESRNLIFGINYSFKRSDSNNSFPNKTIQF
jgi:hypothetical protein